MSIVGLRRSSSAMANSATGALRASYQTQKILLSKVASTKILLPLFIYGHAGEMCCLPLRPAQTPGMTRYTFSCREYSLKRAINKNPTNAYSTRHISRLSGVQEKRCCSGKRSATQAVVALSDTASWTRSDAVSPNCMQVMYSLYSSTHVTSSLHHVHESRVGQGHNVEYNDLSHFAVCNPRLFCAGPSTRGLFTTRSTMYMHIHDFVPAARTTQRLLLTGHLAC